MKGLSLEVRVGLLVLVAVAVLGGFLFILGGYSFEEGYTVYVDFDNPGNVKPGAPVTVAGMKVGSVEQITYRGGELDPQTGSRALVRLELEIEERVRETIHEDAMFYVSSQSVLGEQMIAVDPGSFDRPPLEEGAVVRGVDPPRLDLALALGYELLDSMVTALRNNREELRDMLENIAGILRALNSILTDNREEIDRIIANVEHATAEAAALAQSARGTVDSPEVRRIVNNLDRTLAVVSRDLEPILRDTRAAVGNVNEAIGPEQREQIQTTIENAAQLSERANRTIGEAQAIVAHIREGRGTVGALVMDEELYDDIQEMIRDLKHNPWKFFWRE
jgi:phospholipid/cholesterol/gamma-HCH transport system substrate-binding protein